MIWEAEKMDEKEKELFKKAEPEFKMDKSTLDKIINNFNNMFPNYKIEVE